MDSASEYFSLTISMKPGAGPPPEKIVLYLSKALKQPAEKVSKALAERVIRIPKVRLDANIKKLIAGLEEHGLQVITASLGAVSPPPDATPALASPTPSTPTPRFMTTMRGTGGPGRSKGSETWKEGDVIEGLYEVFGSAEGGMGKVYFIFHRSWKMKLAIKTPLRRAITSETKVLRFLREAELWVDLGLHPNIATCYYARVIDGLPRLFIEYVDGGALDEALDRGLAKDLKIVTDLMLQFCHGMHYAEQRGMIHRDIKPANCLITLDNTLKITDFGLVKRVGDEPPPVSTEETFESDGTIATGRYTETSVTMLEGGIMGSPRYMPPERFRTRGTEDIRSDIYSFGVMLYEVLVDETPFELPEGYSLQELVRAHLKAPIVDPRRYRSDTPKSLVDIIMTCLEKKPQNRFSSFSEVTDALEGTLRALRPGREPRKPPNVVQLKADSLNNQAVSLMDLGRDAEARQLLEDAHSANTEHLEAVYNLHTLKWIRGETSDREVVSRMESLKIETRETPEYYYLIGLIALQRGDPGKAALYFVKSCVEGSQYCDRWKDYGDDPKNFIQSLKLKAIGELSSLAGHIKQVRAAYFIPDSGKAVSLGEDRYIRVWDVETGRCIKYFRTSNFNPIVGAFSPDGKVAATGYGDAYRILDLWDIERGKPLRNYQGVGVTAIAFSPDGARIACFGSDNSLRVWDAHSNNLLLNLKRPEKITCLAFSGAGSRLILGAENGSISLLDGSNGAELFQKAAHERAVSALAAQPNGNYIASGGLDESIVISEANTGKILRRLVSHRGAITGVAFLGESNFLASVSADCSIKLWDFTSGRCFRTMSVPGDEFLCIDASRDATKLITGSAKGSARLWAVDTGWFGKDFLEPALCRPRTFKELVGMHIAFNIAVDDFHRSWKKHDQKHAVECFERIRGLSGFSWSREALLIRNELKSIVDGAKLKSSSFLRAFHGHRDAVVSVEPAHDGRELLTGSLDGSAALWDVVSGKCIRRFSVGPPVLRALFLPEGKGIAVWSKDGVLRGYDFRAALLFECPETEAPIALSPDGADIMLLRHDMRPLRVQWATGARETFGEAIRGTEVVCFGRNLRTLYGIRDGRRIQKWNIASGRLEGALREFTHPFTALMPTWEGDKVIGGAQNGEIVVYHAVSGMNIGLMRGHTAAVRCIAGLSNHSLILSGSDDTSLRLWDHLTEKCLTVLEGHTASVRAVCFFPNMFLAASGSADGSARLWGFEWALTPQERPMNQTLPIERPTRR